ncbi:ATP-binding protein [Streptomyces sp. NPDC029526]|uniref:sensor histidine kinase n=1 Tax=Streptomyces sp. NPDC029526 TaxID=3155728 RepID=UPI0033E6A28C
MSEGSGLQRSQSFMILATGLYRASHLVVGVLAVAQHQRHSPLSWAGVTVALAVSVLLFATARSHGWFTTGPVLTDLLLIGCVLPFVVYAGGARRPAEVAWAMLLGGSASAASAVALRRLPAVAGAVAALLATHAAGYWLTDADVAVVVAHLNAVVASAVMARVFWWYLRRQGSRLDAATAQALAAETERARYAERIAHHRALHDTVLATLTAIATGRADPAAPPVRERCAREAAYLRRLIQQQTEDETTAGAPARAGVDLGARGAVTGGLGVTGEGPAVRAEGPALGGGEQRDGGDRGDERAREGAAATGALCTGGTAQSLARRDTVPGNAAPGNTVQEDAARADLGGGRRSGGRQGGAGGGSRAGATQAAEGVAALTGKKAVGQDAMGQDTVGQKAMGQDAVGSRTPGRQAGVPFPAAAAAAAEAVERAVHSAECLGLRVTAQYHGLNRLTDLPTDVATALGAALTEALNNVLRHAGTGHAYVTVTGTRNRTEDGGGGVTVTAVDRGVGFDPATVTQGLGLRHSVTARMNEAGGAAFVDSAPGEGTRVELRWPA